MLDFGEELTIETFKIPWLVWIQIIILLLLIILLYCFSLFHLDLSQENTGNNGNTYTTLPSSSSSSSSAPLILKQKTTTFRNHLQPSQRRESQSVKGEIATSTSRRIVRGEEITEKESTSPKEASSINYHPCHYFRIARLAFLKCLGLDSTSENSTSTSEHKKDR